MTQSLVKCLETENKIGFITAVGKLSVEKAFESGTGVRKMVLANQKRAYGAIINLIKDTILFFNVGKGINPNSEAGYTQMLEIAFLISEEFPGLRFEELALVFKNAKKGRYGKLYDSLDGLTVIGWIREYENTERESYLVKRGTSYKVNARTIDIIDTRNMSKEDAEIAKENYRKLNEQMYLSYKKVDAERTEKEQKNSTLEEGFQKFNAQYWIKSKISNP